MAAGSAHAMGTEAEFAAKYPFLSVDADRQASILSCRRTQIICDIGAAHYCD